MKLSYYLPIVVKLVSTVLAVPTNSVNTIEAWSNTTVELELELDKRDDCGPGYGRYTRRTNSECGAGQLRYYCSCDHHIAVSLIVCTVSEFCGAEIKGKPFVRSIVLPKVAFGLGQMTVMVKGSIVWVIAGRLIVLQDGKFCRDCNEMYRM